MLFQNSLPIETAAAYNEISIDPPACSRVSGSSEDNLLQSLMVSIEVMALSKEGEEKLRKSLTAVLLEDHEKGLKSIAKTSPLSFCIAWNAIKISEGLKGCIQKIGFQISYPISKKVTS